MFTPARYDLPMEIFVVLNFAIPFLLLIALIRISIETKRQTDVLNQILDALRRQRPDGPGNLL